MTGPHEATPLRDCVDRIWDMRAEMWSDESYDVLDAIVTDAYAAGATAERARIRQLAREHNAQCHHADGTGCDFADLLDGA